MTKINTALNYYEVLGLDRCATSTEISAAFRRKAKELHPDRDPNESTADEFKVLSRAHATLSRPQSRTAYDEQLRKAEHSYYATATKNDYDYFSAAPDPAPKNNEPITFSTGTAMVLPTPRRAGMAIVGGLVCILVGLVLGMIIPRLPAVADSFGRDFTLWFAVVKLIGCGTILAGVGAWRLRGLRALAPVQPITTER